MASRRSIVLIVWLAALAACAAIIARTNFVADLSAFLPSKPNATQRVLVDQLRDGVVARLILVGIEGGDAASRHRISRDMAAQLRKSPAFAAVQNGEAAALEHDRAFFFNNRYLLSPAVTPEHFTVAGLHQSIGESLDWLTSPAGMMIKSLLPRDPTGETLQFIEAFQQQGGPRTAGGVWVSKDDSRALILLQTQAAGSDTNAQAQAIATINAAFSKAHISSTAHLLMTGPGVFSVAAKESIQHEAERVATLSALAVIALLMLIYRSFVLLGLGLLPVLSGAVAGIAAVSLGFGEVHGLTLGFGATLIGEAVDYAVYLFVQSPDASVAGAQRWQPSFWRTVRLGVATSVCGFAAMLISGFPGLAQLGLYSISGLIAAVLVTRFLLPELMPKGLRLRDVSHIGATLIALIDRLARFRWAFGVIAVAAFAVLLVQHAKIWNHSLSALSPVTAQQQSLDASLRADLGAPDVRYMLTLNASDQEHALQAAEQLEPTLRKLVDAGVIAGFDSPTHFLPSIATQRARQAALPDSDTLRSRLKQALVGMPIRAERLTGFITDVEAARKRPLLQRSDLNGSSSALALDSLLTHKADGWSVLIPLRAPSSGKNAYVINADKVSASIAAGASPNWHLIDLTGQTAALYSSYLSEAIQSSALGLAAVIAVIALSLRSLRRVTRVLLPLAGAVLAVMAGLVATGHSLNMLHLVGLLLIVAVGSNYALFFDQSFAGNDTAQQQRIAVSLVLANLTTVAGFGILATSSVPILSALGIVVGPGAFLALLFSAMLAPAHVPTDA
ncbi:MAG TPA: MMPL family transporter [Rhodocyclaceae bacterium]|nr:MMPL family transporter [Rhodocyclaceae bacterium]